MPRREPWQFHFKCPRCDGSYFGTSNAGEPTQERHCNDQFGKGCRYSGQDDDCMIFDPEAEAPPTIGEGKE